MDNNPNLVNSRKVGFENSLSQVSESIIWIKRLQNERVIAVIRSSVWEYGLKMAKAVAEGGVSFIEVTWNSDRPCRLIEQLRESLPQCSIGVGTILTPDALQEASLAGAQFVFSPHTDATLIEKAINHHIPIVTGALTPTEIVTAWQNGATAVKVFPIHCLGGIAYLQSLKPVFPTIPFIPTGGVTCHNTLEYLQAGALAVGLSSDLFPKIAIDTQNWGLITTLAQNMMHRVKGI